MTHIRVDMTRKRGDMARCPGYLLNNVCMCVQVRGNLFAQKTLQYIVLNKWFREYTN